MAGLWKDKKKRAPPPQPSHRYKCTISREYIPGATPSSVLCRNQREVSPVGLVDGRQQASKPKQLRPGANHGTILGFRQGAAKERNETHGREIVRAGSMAHVEADVFERANITTSPPLVKSSASIYARVTADVGC
ncbi:hypothetical protein TEQG_06797 [Trichophyton equinum CBS 127.97]|uniref:Uncharacterized protein n=1 Tax=Trichophyton equinum (strain ATCC MYA-4606 / CBS 127.97) TaxID=559882 RepID=F2Q0U7_TRIEC|nr:hypothetical protein TEQG_06797 [Trichophyton equinum CBS 127.97]